MATKLRSFDFTDPSALTAASKAVYPWVDWLDGDIWQLKEGEDFFTHPLMMERIIRTRAAGRGAKVRLRHVPGGTDSPFGVIVLERTDIIGPEQAKRIEAGAKRQAKREAAKADAEAMLAKAGIKTPKPRTKDIRVPTKRPIRKASAKDRVSA